MNLFPLLFITLLVLKLLNVINWSWWWVTAPLWGGAILLVACAFLAGYLQNKSKYR